MSQVIFRKCHPEHLLLIEAQSAQRSEFTQAVGPALGMIAESGEAWSGWFNNRCIVAGGIFPKWRGTGIVWSLFGANAGRHMVAITRKAQSVIDNSKHRRLEITTLVGFEPAARWARVLGFKVEAPNMPCYDPDGRDMALWAQIRGN